MFAGSPSGQGCIHMAVVEDASPYSPAVFMVVASNFLADKVTEAYY